MKKKAEDAGDDLRPEYPPEFFKDMKANRFTGKELHYKRSAALDTDKAAKPPAKRQP